MARHWQPPPEFRHGLLQAEERHQATRQQATDLPWPERPPPSIAAKSKIAARSPLPIGSAIAGRVDTNVSTEFLLPRCVLQGAISKTGLDLAGSQTLIRGDGTLCLDAGRNRFIIFGFRVLKFFVIGDR